MMGNPSKKKRKERKKKRNDRKVTDMKNLITYDARINTARTTMGIILYA